MRGARYWKKLTPSGRAANLRTGPNQGQTRQK
jgi:hypothetical protein